jgi:hypothetical protein
VGDLADGVGEVVDISEGDEGLTRHEHLHQFLRERVLLLQPALVEELEHHGDSQGLELPEVDPAVDLLGVALESHQLTNQDHQLQIEVGRS